MVDDAAGDVTGLLNAWRGGNKAALDRLTPILYQELRRLAAAYMRRERPDHTLQPTALIHEAYARLVDQSVGSINSRTHFFGVAAHIMRQVLVDSARAHRSEKRGGGNVVQLDTALQVAAEFRPDLLEIHEALERLAAFDERKAKVVELRYFGGLTREEVAEALGLTLATVKRDLALAEAWLRRELTPPSAPAGA
jgi:RNA polymerase sigma factor (TIGR02999 family)